MDVHLHPCFDILDGSHPQPHQEIHIKNCSVNFSGSTRKGFFRMSWENSRSHKDRVFRMSEAEADAWYQKLMEWVAKNHPHLAKRWWES